MRSEQVDSLAVFRLALGLALAGLLAAGGVATAAPASVAPARLEVEALPACSTRDELVARVVARSTRIRFVNDASRVPDLTARLEIGAKGVVVAELLVVEPDGRKFQRRIEAPSCAAATDALALVIAITLDPSANTGEVSPGGTTDAANAASPPAEAPPRAQEAAPAVASLPPSPARAADVDTVAADGSPAGAFRFTVGVGAEAVAGPAPVAMPGPAVELQAGYERTSILSPALVLTFAHLWSDPLNEGAGTARFALDWAGLDACPVRLAVARIEVRACAAASFGRLTAEGSETYDPRAVARPFATAGGAARLSLLLPLHLEVRARFGAGATLWRDAFQFRPDVFHRVASVTLVGDVGIGVRFP